MKKTQVPESVIEMFESLNLDLRHATATSMWGSLKCQVLFTKVNMTKFLELESGEGSGTHREDTFPRIVSVMEALGSPVRLILAQMRLEDDIPLIPTPTLKSWSETVESALEDAETLLRASGPANAVDRAHTALHGYLEFVLEGVGIPCATDASITALFGLLRQHHPKLKITDPQAQRMIVQVLRGLAAVVDSLDPIRNQKSLAHPNPVLLEEAEAALAINSMRTLLHYLSQKLVTD